MKDVGESLPLLVTTISTTKQVPASTQVTIHSIEYDLDEEDEEQVDEGLDVEEDDEEFITLSILPSFDDVPASMVEHSILDFIEAMEQMSQEQQIVMIPSGVDTVEASPLVSFIITTMALRLVSTTIETTSSSQVPNVVDTTILVPVSQDALTSS